MLLGAHFSAINPSKAVILTFDAPTNEGGALCLGYCPCSSLLDEATVKKLQVSSARVRVLAHPALSRPVPLPCPVPGPARPRPARSLAPMAPSVAVRAMKSPSLALTLILTLNLTLTLTPTPTPTPTRAMRRLSPTVSGSARTR